MTRCRARTAKGKPCNRQASLGSKYCWQHKRTTGRQRHSHNVVYPWASSLLEWLTPLLTKYKVPFRNPDTGGDYYLIHIKGAEHPMEIDWKHLSEGELDLLARQLRPHNVTFKWATNDSGYSVSITKSHT